MMSTSITKRADYGIDAPPVIRNLLIAGLASIAAGVILDMLLDQVQYTIAIIVLIWGALAGGSMLLTAGLMLRSSKVGKVRLREQLMDSLNLRGDETVLDVGCGRGLLLTAAARRLPAGKAIGIDLWQSVDQSGNRPGETLANAQAEGVASRVEIRTGDMRELPFPDGMVDAVVSSLAIHNIPDRAGRVKAVQEIARVLKPGGQALLLDFQAIDEYAQVFREMGWQQVDVSRLNFQMFPPVRIVRGRKPSNAR